MPKHDALVKAYIGALEIREVTIHAAPDGRPARIGPAPEGNLDLFDMLWFEKPQHIELVLSQCQSDIRATGAERPDGWIDLSAQEVRDLVVNAAAMLGATWKTGAEIEADASNAVAEIVEDVEIRRQSGGLSQVNRDYKIYRQRQLASGQKAIPYSAHLDAFTRSLVVLAAKSSAAC